jgi:hypothetical protein
MAVFDNRLLGNAATAAFVRRQTVRRERKWTALLPENRKQKTDSFAYGGQIHFSQKKSDFSLLTSGFC